MAKKSRVTLVSWPKMVFIIFFFSALLDVVKVFRYIVHSVFMGGISLWKRNNLLTSYNKSLIFYFWVKFNIVENFPFFVFKIVFINHNNFCLQCLEK